MVGEPMTVSAYQVDNVIKAYNKQQKTKVRFDMGQSPVLGKNSDVVTLSGDVDPGKEAFSKISYSLLDILAKQKKA